MQDPRGRLHVARCAGSVLGVSSWLVGSPSCARPPALLPGDRRPRPRRPPARVDGGCSPPYRWPP